MKPCTRVGLDVTRRCNWRCSHCFYTRNPRFGEASDVPLREIYDKVRRACEGGLDHAVLTGYGEPTLCANLFEIIDHCHACGLATSIITNGATGLNRFAALYDSGLDHLHVSAHGRGEVLDRIAGSPGAGRRQAELLDWLAAEGLPWRSNVTLQQLNYRTVPELVGDALTHSVRHFVLLGFLPHYEWGTDGQYVREVAVHPGELRPHIEAAADVLLDARTPVTIRYHPLCHLSPQYWPYVTNARHVYMDPWEWNYDLQVHDLDALWQASVRIGESVACAEPCNQCLAYRHCGGWNKVMQAAFGGAGLTPVRDVPDAYADVWEVEGGLHDLNPANAMEGKFCS